MLYECLTGTPPFRRETEAETLWAHMQDQPPPLPDPALDPVLRRALAKERDERYPTCTQLIQDTRAALGLSTPGPSPLSRPGLLRRRHAILAAGLLILIAAVAAAIVALTSGDGGPAPQALLTPGSVASIDPASGRILGAVALPGGPSRLAVGGGQVWVGAQGSRFVTALDARRHDVMHTVAPNAFPGALALGAGAVWLADRGSGSVVEIDPSYWVVVKRITLPNATRLAPVSDSGSFDPWSVAAGDGAVWVTDGSRRLYEIDPVRHKVARTLRLGHPLDGVAVGDGQVWAISGAAALVLRVDARTGRVRERIPIASRPGFRSPYPIALGVSAGSVWVLNGNTATVTRIDLAQGGSSTTIPIGFQHAPRRLAVGRSAVYVANADGTLTRIDAATNTPTTFPLARSLLDVGVAGGQLWVTAGVGAGPAAAAPGAPAGSRVRALSPTVCSPVFAAPGRQPRYLVASDLPLQDQNDLVAGQMVTAVQLVLRERGFRAGRFAVGYQSCDDAVVPFSVTAVAAKCAANARGYARDRSVIGVIGPYASTCTANEIGVLNRAPGGPVAIVNATSTYVGLTQAGAGVAPGEPDRYYPTGQRNFARVIAADNVQAAADALVAHRLGVRRFFLLNDGSNYGVGLAADAAHSARTLGITISGSAEWGNGPRYVRLARRIARAHADGVLLAGALYDNGAQLIDDLAGVLGPRVHLLAPDGFYAPTLVQQAGVSAEGMTVSVAGTPLSTLPREGQRFVAHLRAALHQEPHPFAIYAAQATDILLGAIGRSDGTRGSVSRELLRTHVHDGVLGDFAFTPRGDTTSGAVTIFRVARDKLRLFDVITPPARLVAGG